MHLPIQGLQLNQDPNGAWSVESRPGASIVTTKDHEPVFDWLTALALPHDREALERLAQPCGFSHRHLRFVLADESVTTLTGSPRLQPRQWIYAPGGYHLTLGHLGLVVAYVDDIVPAQPGELPEGSVEGMALIGEATLYDSGLADAAWRGVEAGIFGHVCATIQRLAIPVVGEEVLDRYELLEVALIDRPACLNARILKTWED